MGLANAGPDFEAIMDLDSFLAGLVVGAFLIVLGGYVAERLRRRAIREAQKRTLYVLDDLQPDQDPVIRALLAEHRQHGRIQ